MESSAYPAKLARKQYVKIDVLTLSLPMRLERRCREELHLLGLDGSWQSWFRFPIAQQV